MTANAPTSFDQAERLLAEGAYAAAAASFIQLLQADAFDKAALRGLCRAQEALHDTASLMPLLRNLVQERPDDPDYAALLSRLQTGPPSEPVTAPRLQTVLASAKAQLHGSNLAAAAASLWRANLLTGFADGGLVQALTDVYRQEQNIPALKELWKRSAAAALERGDLDRFLEHSYVSIYAEQMFSAAPNYSHATIDLDLRHYARQAARQHPLRDWVARHRAQPRGAGSPLGRPLRVGFVLEGLSQTQAPTRAYFPLVEHHDEDRFELFFYSRFALSEALAQRDRYAETAAFLESYGAEVWMPAKPLAPAQQVEALARQIVSDEVDVLVYQTTYFVPQLNVLAALSPAPVQALIEHQQPEHAHGLDLVFTPEKASLESAAPTASFPISFVQPEPEEPAPREAFGIPEDAVVLVSANRGVRYRQEPFWDHVRTLLRARPNVYFLALGLDDAAPFLADAPDLAARVITPGFRRDVTACLAAADIYIDLFPSGGGSSMIEAMFCGLPVVCFAQDLETLYAVNNETLSEYVGIPELLVPREAPDQWHDLVGRLVEDPAYRAEMSRAVRKRTHDFAPATVAERFFEALAHAYDRA